MVATAKDIRVKVKAQLAEQLRIREEAAISVVTGAAAVETAQGQLDAAEATYARAVSDAITVIGVKDLADLTGVSPASLRRLSKSTSPTEPMVTL